MAGCGANGLKHGSAGLAKGMLLTKQDIKRFGASSASPNRLFDGGYVPEIDGLRAVAVGTVMLFHLKASLMPGGFTGVDIFFVISGYVVSASLFRDSGGSLLSRLQRFYARRVMRIAPALMVCLLAAIAATVLFIPTSWLSNLIERTANLAFFGASNFALVNADSYFSPWPEFNPFTHTWSLAVEEQFYLLYPLLFLLWSHLRQRGAVAKVVAALLLPAVSLISFFILWRTSQSRPEASFYMLPSRFWELGAGALLFQLQVNHGALLAALARSRVATGLGVALAIVSAVGADRHSFPFPWAIPAVLSAFLLINAVAAEKTDRPVARVLRSAPMTFVGRLSYPLYLWHWPVYALFRWTIGLETPAQCVAAVGLSFLFAYLSYAFVERPFRKGGWVHAQRKSLVLVGGFAVILLCWGVGRLAFVWQDRLSASVVMQNMADWYPHSRSAQKPATPCVDEIHGAIDGAVLWVNRPLCVKATHPRLFVLGDSHAAAYNSMFFILAAEQGVEVLLYHLNDRCSAGDLLRPSEPACSKAIRSSVDDILTRAAPGDFIFLASLRMNRLSGQLGPLDDDEIALRATSRQAVEDRELAYQEAARLIGEFTAKGLRVIIDAPKPVFKAPAFRCSDWFNASNPTCRSGLTIKREQLLEARRPVMDELARLAATYPKLVIWDPFPTLCPDETCEAVTRAGPLFIDGDHMSGFGGRLLYPSFLSALQPLWRDDKARKD